MQLRFRFTKSLLAVAMLAATVGLSVNVDPAVAQGATCDGMAPTITGTNKGEVLRGTSGDDVILGLGGKDKIDGRGGNDIICGGSGNDTIKGGGGNDRLFGDKGKDKLIGGGGNDALYGGAGKDTLNGGNGDDGPLNGGPGKDKINGGKGTDDCVAAGDRLKKCEDSDKDPDPKPEPEPDRNALLGEGPFTWSQSGHSWDITLTQVLSIEMSEYGEAEAGDCFAVLASVTVLDLPNGRLSSGYENPAVGLVDSRGQSLDSAIGDCDTEAIEDAGYVWRLYHDAIEGATVGTFEVYQTPNAPILATVGRPTDRPSRVYDVDVTTALVAPIESPGPAPAINAELGEASFALTDYDHEWTVELTQVIQVPRSDSSYRPSDGDCYAVVGTATLNELPDGQFVSDDAPDLGMIDTRGRSLPRATECDWGSLENAGYIWALNVELVEGGSVGVFETFRSPSKPAAVTVGYTTAPAGVYSAPLSTNIDPA